MLMEAVLISAAAGRTINPQAAARGSTSTSRSSTNITGLQAFTKHMHPRQTQGQAVSDGLEGQVTAPSPGSGAVQYDSQPDLPLANNALLSDPCKDASPQQPAGSSSSREDGLHRIKPYVGRQLPVGYKAPYALTSKLGPGVWWMILRCLKISKSTSVLAAAAAAAAAAVAEGPATGVASGTDSVHQLPCALHSAGASMGVAEGRGGEDHDGWSETAISDVVSSVQLLHIQACLGLKSSKVCFDHVRLYMVYSKSC
jgi:hypothetical protein